MSDSSRLESLLTILKDSPKDSFMLFAVAKEYEGIEDLGNAKKYYEKLVQVDPNYVGVYFHLAALYIEIEDFEKAVQTFDSGIEIAISLNDLHALSELKSAKMNFEIEY